VVAVVSCRFGGDAEGLSTDEPFSCHPPDTGEGIATGAAVAVGAPAKLVTKPAISDMTAKKVEVRFIAHPPRPLVECA
jgi:hypothetical protein